MGKRYLEPWEIKELMKQKAMEKRQAECSPFTGMATLCNYVLWKKYHYSSSKLAKYNEDFQMYKDDIDNGFYDYNDLQSRILEIDPDMVIESIDYTEADNPYKKNGFLRNCIGPLDIEQNNIINAESVKYLKIFFNVMIDYNFDQKKLRKIRDYISEYLNTYMYNAPKGGKRIMDLWHELEDGTGIHIELPEV